MYITKFTGLERISLEMNEKMQLEEKVFHLSQVIEPEYYL